MCCEETNRELIDVLHALGAIGQATADWSDGRQWRRTTIAKVADALSNVSHTSQQINELAAFLAVASVGTSPRSSVEESIATSQVIFGNRPVHRLSDAIGAS